MPKTVPAIVMDKKAHKPIRSPYFPDARLAVYYVTLQLDTATWKQLKQGQTVDLILPDEESEQDAED